MSSASKVNSSAGENPSAPGDDEISFDTNGLYILFSDIGAMSQFHWGLYLALSPNHGIVFHVVNNITTGGRWQYQTKTSTGVPSSRTLLLAMKIAVMDPSLHSSLVARLAAVPVTQSITCRIWLKQALFDLDNEGYIKLTKEVDDIEMEGILFAEQNKALQQKSSMNSQGSQA